ncbi:3-oxoacyl-(acyl-carrier-protein) reductase [Thermobaculum terrenum ATCC BAA-798]|uniref:3-oxoacyl-[acyl-carrier-protein] reductase n=1 Tax=Thermobaculum terrenum (strain ATCC BAA-798 / CCMEE 7001 / YNP1) TaxID=525904 RepID=D1CDC9_THET1|nr:3-oxoacyl-[acyl-carrier-protein] reductase [Thermobaculum terrenum]ACZ40935.1 3-oxoacyl-(acyl-carrier-protein) reductase [Thermobaculum terrenum ATCC BAA-798]
MDLEGKVALVTGGSRGIGRATAIKLASLGARVVVNYNRSKEAAEEVVRAISEAGGEAVASPGDVSTKEGAENAVNTALNTWGKIDILVNNAGITRDTLLMRMSEEDWEAVIDTNLKGAYLCSKLAVRSMLRNRWGRIINISSVVGLVGNVGQANYASAKAGLLGLTKSIAREFGSKNITANAIAPGYIETDIVAVLSEDIKKAILSQIPAGRYGKPEEVAELVAFLASDKAAYINGQTINIDGGMVMI